MGIVAFLIYIALLGFFYMLGWWDGVRAGKVRGAQELRDHILLDVKEGKYEETETVHPGGGLFPG